MLKKWPIISSSWLKHIQIPCDLRLEKKFSTIVLFILVLSTGLLVSSCKKNKEDKIRIPGCTNTDALNFLASATEDDGSCVLPEQKSRTIVINFTSLTCGNCGSYGIPALISAYTNFPDDVIPLKVNTGDELSCSVGMLLSFSYNYSSIPYFVVGNQEGVFYSDLNSTIAGQIGGTCNAGLAGVFSVSGSTISIKTQVKFYAADQGEYYLAVYLMEDGLSAIQSGQGSAPYIHNKVLRGNAVGNSAHGELITNQNVPAGTIINKTYTAQVLDTWNPSNMYAALVLWKKIGNDWEYINACQTKAN